MPWNCQIIWAIVFHQYIFQLLYIAQYILKVSQTQVFLSFSNLKMGEFQLPKFPSPNSQILKDSVLVPYLAQTFQQNFFPAAFQLGLFQTINFSNDLGSKYNQNITAYPLITKHLYLLSKQKMKILFSTSRPKTWPDFKSVIHLFSKWTQI